MKNGTEQKKYSYSINGIVYSESTFNSIEESVKEAIKDYNKKEFIDGDYSQIEICKNIYLESEDVANSLVDYIDEVNDGFACCCDIDAETMVDGRESLVNGIAELIDKHCSFNPVFICDRIGTYDLVKNELKLNKQ